MVHRAMSVEGLLGIEAAWPASPLALSRAVATGLPAAAVERLATAVAPDDARFKYRLVPPATLRRRRLAGRLTAVESDRLARLAKVFGMALEIYRAPEGARNFMRRPHPMLEGATPLDVVLAADPGADVVINLLGRAAYSGGV